MLVWVPSVIAVVIAVLVPWFTFRLALRQDRIRRLHDQRADLYIELLTEAYAEKDYFEYEIEDDETRERMRSYRRDLRLQPPERARLGARATIFASREVNRLFTTLQAQALAATLAGRPKDEAERLAARLRVGQAFDGLEAQVRREIGTDEIRA